MHAMGMPSDPGKMREGPCSLGELIDVRRAELLVIHDVWVGYNEESPIARIWNLRRKASGELRGEGRFPTGSLSERVVDVVVDATKTRRFLDTVAGAQVVPGDYEPLITHTDDSPLVEVALHVPVAELHRRHGVALLFTESQGRFHAPWGVCLAGWLGVIPGPEVGQALSKLDEPLQRKLLDDMMEDASGER